MSAQKNLRKARKVRSAIASDFDALQSGVITIRDVLERPMLHAPALSSVDVWDVLRRAPHLGRAGAKKILLTARVWPHTRLGDLTPYERDEILRCLPPRATS